MILTIWKLNSKGIAKIIYTKITMDRLEINSIITQYSAILQPFKMSKNINYYTLS